MTTDQPTGGFPGVEIQDEENLTDDERDALFGYDPFDEDKPEELPPLEEEAPAVEAGAEEAPAEEAPVVEEPVVEEPPMSAREKLMHEQNELLRGQLSTQEEMIKAINASKPKPAAGEEPQPEDNIPPYMFPIPDEYIAALRDEDPNKVRAALQGIMSGTARAVHFETRKEHREFTQNAIASYVNRHARSSQISSGVMEDYYGKFKAHNRPELQSVVVAAAQRIMKQENSKEWSPTLRDKIGAEVTSILSAAVQQGAPPGGGGQPAAAEPEQNTQSRAAAGKGRPGGPKQTRPTSRPAPETKDSVGAQVEDLFG